jgi:hypothetical protein
MNRHLFLAGVLPVPDAQAHAQRVKPRIFEGCCCFFYKESAAGVEDKRRCVYFSPTRENSDCTEMKLCIYEHDPSAHGILGTCDGSDVWINFDEICHVAIKPPVHAKKQPQACVISLSWGLVVNVYPTYEDGDAQNGQEHMEVCLYLPHI